MVIDGPGQPRTSRSVGDGVGVDLGTALALQRPNNNSACSPVRPTPRAERGSLVAEIRKPAWAVLLPVVGRSLLVLGAWGLAVTLAARVHPTGWVRTIALFGHLVGLVCGFGAVIVLDVYGAACLTRRRSPVDVARLSTSLDPLIWGGFLALITTGALLAPHLAHPLTRIKLAAVLVVGLNGVNASGLREAVASLRPSATLRELPSRLLWRLVFTATASQLAWWTAVLIGFKNTPHN
jgi:hypothetical protein